MTAPQPAAALATRTNTSFSKVLPGLQLAVDSTSMGAFKECPRKYYYSIIQGYQPKATSTHLRWGIWIHQGRESYDALRARGADHREALHAVVWDALGATWDAACGRPWVSDMPEKNRLTLVRTLVWYLDEFGENDPIKTVTLANGRSANELSFRFAAGKAKSTGEDVLMCGHLDRVGQLGEELYVVDIKTTKSSLSPSFFAQFSPGNQMSTYAYAARIVFGLPVRGVIIDGIQVGATFSRHQRGLVHRSEAQLDEWVSDWWVWYGQMEAAASWEHWPMNDKSCGNYGGCPFQGVCARAGGARQQWLDLNFTKRIWDPLQVRGEL